MTSTRTCPAPAPVRGGASPTSANPVHGGNSTSCSPGKTDSTETSAPGHAFALRFPIHLYSSLKPTNHTHPKPPLFLGVCVLWFWWKGVLKIELGIIVALMATN